MPECFDSIGKTLRPLRLVPAAIVAAVGVSGISTNPAAAKTPGAVHCYGGLCHRVATIAEMDGMVGRRGYLQASFYDHCKRDRFNPCGLTSSGAVFRADLPDNAASPIFPDGTVLLVYNHESRQAVVVRVTSAGPYWGDRKLDLSRAAAERLGFAQRGVASVEVMVLKSPQPEETRYKRRRIYETVPGHLGQFETFEDARDAAIAGLRLETNGIQVASIAPEQVVTDHAPVEIAKPRFPIDAEFRHELRPVAAYAKPSLTEAPPVLAALRPETSIAARSLESVSLTSSLAEKLAQFFAVARAKARLERTEQADASSRLLAFSGASQGFIDRVRAFIEAAEAHARLPIPATSRVLAAQ